MERFLNIFSKKRRCLPVANARSSIAAKYKFFKSLLKHNHTALKAIADLEQLYYSGKPFSLSSIRINYEELLEAVTGVIHSLQALSGKDMEPLAEVAGCIDRELFKNFNPKCAITIKDFVLPFEEITPEMKKTVGAKAANLAVIKNVLGLPVPQGFAVTASAFEHFIEENRLLRHIKEELSHISSDAPETIERASGRLREMVLNGKVPASLSAEILKAYEAIEQKLHRGVRIAMRSSAVGEDTEATFAGQYETVLNVKKENIIDAYKTVLASKYSARAIAYRLQYGLDDRETPMCVIGIEMIDATSSGVLYSVDPALRRSCPVKINSLWGVGEHLVDGSASPDVFIIDRIDKRIVEKHVARKGSRMINRREGGTMIEQVPESERQRSSLDDAKALELAHYGLLLEEFFESPQDVEWALDSNNDLFILQSRPLNLPEITAEESVPRDYPDHPVLLSQGRAAASGIATGRVFIVEHDDDLKRIPHDAILVARTASPEYAKAIGRIRGIITDIGSVTSHMSSVAREFGIPAIVDAGNATVVLPNGRLITMWADTTRVYDGVVESLVREMKPARKLIFDSPLHRRMRRILDKIAPLNLTDPEAPTFTPEGCQTFHDIIRYTHEYAMREMFGLSEDTGETGRSVKLTTRLPLNLRMIDLGGGLREGLTSCDTVTPDCIASTPMRAVWKGFTHPGVNWAGTMSFDRSKLSGLLAAAAASEFGDTGPGESYAILSRDYLNLSVRFAYHFATIDTLCSDKSTQNYISLQFSGGAGSYYGRSLRIQLIGTVLERLGFKVTLKGDLIEAFIARYDRQAIEEKLDLMGRLLASSRLLDMVLSNQEEIDFYAAAFFSGNYDFLTKGKEDEFPGFYVRGGYWKRLVEEGHPCCLQDGSRWGRRVSSEFSGLMGKVIGNTYREFLDTIEAYYYFPLLIMKDMEFSQGAITAGIKPMRGNIDRAGGIAFGIRDTENYFVLRTNSLEGNIVLFEFVEGRRVLLFSVTKRIENNQWHLLKAELTEDSIKGYYNDELVMEYPLDQPIRGFIGLWTKSDSVICFKDLVIETGGGRRTIAF